MKKLLVILLFIPFLLNGQFVKRDGSFVKHNGSYLKRGIQGVADTTPPTSTNTVYEYIDFGTSEDASLTEAKVDAWFDADVSGYGWEGTGDDWTNYCQLIDPLDGDDPAFEFTLLGDGDHLRSNIRAAFPSDFTDESVDGVNDRVFFSYNVFFPTGFDFDGGKMPGISLTNRGTLGLVNAGKYPPSCYPFGDARDDDIYETDYGSTFRLHMGECCDAEDFDNITEAYAYYHNMTFWSCANQTYGDNIGTNTGVTTGEWHNVAIRLVENTVTTNLTDVTDDGVFEFYWDHVLIFKKTDIRMRNYKDMHLDHYYLAGHYGGARSSSPDRLDDNYMYVDDYTLWYPDDPTVTGNNSNTIGHEITPPYSKIEDESGTTPTVYDDSLFIIKIAQDFASSGVPGSTYNNSELQADFNSLPYTGGLASPEYCTLELIDSDTCLRLWAEAGEWTNSDFTIQLDSTYDKLYLTYDMKVRDGMIIYPRVPISPADNSNDYGGKLPGMGGSWAGGSGMKDPEDCVDPTDGSWKRRSRWSYEGEGGTYGWDQDDAPDYASYILTTGHDWWDTTDSACVGEDCYLIYDNVDWVTYTMGIEMNTVGSADGHLTIFVGDSCIYANATIEWRGDNAVGIDFLFPSLWFGGDGKAVVDEYLDWDNVCVWRYADDIIGSTQYPTVTEFPDIVEVGDKIPIPSFAGRRTD